MIYTKILSGKIYEEFSQEDSKYWFDFKQKKFLHNVDTLYYSIKLQQDFTSDSADTNVLQFRRFFQNQYEVIDTGFGKTRPFHYAADEEPLNIVPITYSKYYTICLECPEYFDIFFAPVVPKAPDGLGSVTCECIVQIRSYLLWLYGVQAAFDISYKVAKAVIENFSLSVDFVQENRVDYCWHSNYLTNPERFFSIENFYQMRVDRFHGALFHTEKVGSEGHEVDYVALGNRGSKCFIRIYLKSKEVIEQGYKAFFLRTWLFHGLINRYDLYCYELAYLRASWQYMTIARLQFYLEYGADAHAKQKCEKYIKQFEKAAKVTDAMLQLADELTPKVNLVINVEYQTMRKSTKSYTLIPIKANDKYGELKRIYDFFDNHKIIIEYLTHDTFRLVDKNGDTNKSRRDYCAFWKALRCCKKVDIASMPDELKLRREYNRNMNAQRMKEQMINKAITYGIYVKGVNEDDVEEDCMLPILQLNDNDIEKAKKYKKKRLRQFNRTEFAAAIGTLPESDYVVINNSTGQIYDNPKATNCQEPEGGEADDDTADCT